MAIYHLSVKPVSRAKGHSAISKAAYRAAEKLYDERLQQYFDYTKKNDVFYKEILTPCGTPTWMKDRETLWNYSESVEKRKDARPAMEIEVSLPKELTEEQNVKLIKEFVKSEIIDLGLIADVCLHYGHDKEQPHAHILYTTRSISEGKFGKKVEEIYERNFVYKCREAWANIANRHLALNDHDVKIDHRSFRNQGIELEPQKKIGPVSGRERYTENLELHQGIMRRNGDKIFSDPNIALDALTRQQSTFTMEDLARFINRNTEDIEQFSKVFEKVKNSHELVYLGIDEKGKERFSSQGILDLEYKMIMQGVAKSTSSEHEIDLSQRDGLIKKHGLSKEQGEAFKHIVGDRDLACVVGFAGTGKSYMLRAARELWEEGGYRVQGMTLSGIAAEGLEGKAGIKSYTVASRIRSWDNDYERLTAKDIVVVDEAGMLGSHDLSRIMEESVRGGAKVVLIGDPEQLQAILAGGAFKGLLSRVGYIELNDIRRQKENWQKEATKLLATCGTKEALEMYKSRGFTSEHATQAEAMKAMVEAWNENRRVEPDKSRIMGAYLRSEVASLNELARNWRKEYGELGEERIYQINTGNKEFAVNDVVYFLRNDKDLAVKNGTLGTVEKVQKNTLTIKVGHESKVVDIRDYNYLAHGYAATIHKLQGVTVDRQYLLASEYFNRHIAYVGLTRHTESVELFWAREKFDSFKDLVRTFSRARLKDISLDYIEGLKGYANNRGIFVDKEFKVNSKAIEQRFLEVEKTYEFGATKELVGKELNKMFVECHPEGGEKGQYLGDIAVDGKNMSIIESGVKAYLIDVKHKEEIDIGNDVRIEALATESGKKELGIINEKNWKIERILETNKQNELNEARYLVNKASRKLSGMESWKMNNKIDIKQIYGALYHRLPEILPEFGFVARGNHYVSTTGEKVDGSVGKAGKVYVYANNPGMLMDYTRDNKSIWDYIKDRHMCGAGNKDIFEYLISQAGLRGSFEEKFELLNKATYQKKEPLPDKSPQETIKPAVDSQLWEKVYEFALGKIKTPNNQVTRYLEQEREYTKEIIAKMGIGYIPSKKEFSDYLKTNGVSEKQIKEVMKSLGYIGGSHKMIFPYYDREGQIVGLAARNIKHNPDDELAKYMYTKGLSRQGSLVSIHEVNPKIKEITIVEGLLDCLHAKACGISNVVALGGTGFNYRQVELIKNMGIDKITLCLDNDKAGQNAAHRIASLIYDKHPNAEVKFVNLPAGVKDLDELLTTKGIHISNEIIAKAEIKHKVSLEEIRTKEIEYILTKSHEQRLTAKL